jgi:ribosome-associated protein
VVDAVDTTESTRWAVEAARGADDKKGADTLVLAVGDVLAVTDYFVITSGTNPRQVRTIADEVEQRISEAGGPKPLRIEGLDDLTWVLLDYGDFVVHVFHEDARRYYELERLWADVPRLDWAEERSASTG